MIGLDGEKNVILLKDWQLLLYAACVGAGFLFEWEWSALIWNCYYKILEHIEWGETTLLKKQQVQYWEIRRASKLLSHCGD